MRATVRAGLTLAGVFFVAKLLFYFTGWHHTQYPLLMGINLLCLILAIFIGLRQSKAQGTVADNFGAELKTGMQSALVYAMLVAGMVLLYYSAIDQYWLQEQIDDRMTQVDAMIADPAVEIPSGFTKESIRAQELESAEAIYSPFAQTTVTLIGLAVGGFFYTLLIVLLQRKVLSRLGRQ